MLYHLLYPLSEHFSVLNVFRYLTFRSMLAFFLAIGLVLVLQPRFIQWFKTITTNEYVRNIKLMRWPHLNGTLWQRTYYEHIIRNEHELHEIRRYIKNNPAQWDIDKDNPIYF